MSESISEHEARAIKFHFPNACTANEAMQAFWRERYPEEKEVFRPKSHHTYPWLVELTYREHRTMSSVAYRDTPEALNAPVTITIASYGWFKPLSADALAAIRQVESLRVQLGTAQAEYMK